VRRGAPALPGPGRTAVRVCRRLLVFVVTRSARIYSLSVAAVFAATCGVLVLVEGVPRPSLSTAAALLALAVVGEELVVFQRERAGTPVFSFSAPAHVAAAIMLPPVAAGAVAALGVALSDGLRPGSRRFLFLNASMFGISTCAAAAVYRIAGGDHSSLARPSVLAVLALLVLVAIRYLMTSLILAGGTMLMARRTARFAFGESLWGELESAVGEGSLGILVAVAFLPGHWLIFVLLLPLLGALYRSKAIFQQLKEETHEALDAVATVIDERHPTTAEHTQRVADYVRRFTDEIELPEREADRLVVAARFHDIGKIAVDAATLSKAERLTDAEMASIRRHPRLSARLLGPFHFAREIARFVEYHHERFDGGGYYSVDGARVPIEAHVLIVADSFDAMTSPRSYRPALTTSAAVNELLDKSGTQFHPLVARAFAAMVSDEPVAAVLTVEELAALRASFSRQRRVALPERTRLLDPRLLTIGLSVLALLFVGRGDPADLIAASLGGGVLLSGAVWLLETLALRRKVSLAVAALDAGATADVALSASGIAEWFAWLVPDATGNRYVALDRDVALDEDLRDACEWASRRETVVHTNLNGGRHLLISPASGAAARLAIVLKHRASHRMLEVCESLCTTAALPEVKRPSLRLVESERSNGIDAVVAVDLGVYDDVRRNAGQLLAQRVVAEAERRLQLIFRESDNVRRLGDDRFAVDVRVRDESDLEAITERVAEELSTLEIPRRIVPPAPSVRGALRPGPLGPATLARVAEELLAREDSAVRGAAR
jgi:HD-GYP domain-containing protein (c-di-GMP phosphodiesterase class II)